LYQTHRAILAKRANGLHSWYRKDPNKGEWIVPDAEQIALYTDTFAPPNNIYKRVTTNVKVVKQYPGSISSEVWPYLNSKLYVAPKSHNYLAGQEDGRKHTNPYYDFWKYSCQELEWAGPRPDTVKITSSHHLLVIFYHHFGCVCPSYQALWAIASLAQPQAPRKKNPVRPIYDIGSGTGYWTFMLRKLSLELPEGMKKLEIQAVDNMTSKFRTRWIRDTIKDDAEIFLKHESEERSVLLLVYPQAGGSLTEKFLRAFNGDVIVVAGTQNKNGFTGFTKWVIDEWMEKEMPHFEKVLQIPLPSFAGKDDALFAFKKKGAK
jgi:hypothetical protein